MIEYIFLLIECLFGYYIICNCFNNDKYIPILRIFFLVSLCIVVAFNYYIFWDDVININIRDVAILTVLIFPFAFMCSIIETIVTTNTVDIRPLSQKLTDNIFFIDNTCYDLPISFRVRYRRILDINAHLQYVAIKTIQLIRILIMVSFVCMEDILVLPFYYKFHDNDFSNICLQITYLYVFVMMHYKQYNGRVMTVFLGTVLRLYFCDTFIAYNLSHMLHDYICFIMMFVFSLINRNIKQISKADAIYYKNTLTTMHSTNIDEYNLIINELKCHDEHYAPLIWFIASN